MKIIAVGNSFYGDDGVGAAVLEKIRQDGLFLGAELIDVHTDALALLEHLAFGQKNVIVDAAQMGLEPGAVVGFRPEEVRMKIKSDHLSMPGFGLAEAFALAGQLNKMPADVLIVPIVKHQPMPSAREAILPARCDPIVVGLFSFDSWNDFHPTPD